MKKNVLIVDDSNTNNFLIQSILNEEGIVSTIAFNGEEAIKLIGTEKPSLVLLDIMMPDQDGFSVLNKIKENPKTKHIPVLFITASSDDNLKQKAVEAGAVDLIPKPIDVFQLIKTVKEILMN